MSFLNDLFGHHEAQNAHQQVYGDGDQREHQSSFKHEAIAGAAGFAALKAYEDHVRRSGEQVSHPMMKEMLAGFAAAEVDKLFETKGLDYLDREKAQRMAVQQAHKLAHDKYGPGQVYQGQDNNQGTNYQQGEGNYYQNQGYQQNQSNNYDQGGQQQQQQWGGEDDQPVPEHHRHHHHRREEDD